MFDDRCQLCDEGNEPGEEIAEFRTGDPANPSVVAHAQCGFDAGMELA